MTALPTLDDIQAERDRRKDAGDDLFTFIDSTHPDYRPKGFHKHVSERLQAWANFETRNLIIVQPPRTGKALAVGTPVLTPNKGFVSIEDLRPGDQVLGTSGAPINVTSVSPVFRDRPVYEVTTNDGGRLVVDENHEWLVQTSRPKNGREGCWAVRETKTLKRSSAKNRAWPIPRQGISELVQRELPLDPWAFGFWLGDGCTHHATITVADQDYDWVRAKFEAAGYTTSDRSTEGTFGLVDGFFRELRILGVLHDKFIPDEYLYSSPDQRLALLQGLMDSDGHVDSRGGCEFCSTNKSLADGVQFLLRSFGVHARIRESRARLDGRDCGPRYRISFYMKGAASLPRKANYTRDGQGRAYRYIRVRKMPKPQDTVCIEVDSDDHLFLAGEALLPTHNSEHATRRLPAWLFGRNPSEQILMLAHTQPLANSFSTDVRRIMRAPRYRTIFPRTRLPQPGSRSRDRIGEDELATKAEWETVGYHGRFRAAGVGVGIVGGGYRRAITDDVFKSIEEAYSLAARDRVWSWYTNDVRSRLEYPYSELLVNTRWHKDDLIGRLLESEGTVEEGGKWEVIHLPFLQNRAPVSYDDREPGEPLWPEWFKAPWEHLPDEPPPDIALIPEAEEPVEVTREELVDRAVKYYEDYKGDRDAVLQGQPVPEGGNIIKTDWMQQHWNRLPAGDVEWVIFCDPKGGSKDPKSSRAVIQIWCRARSEPAKLYLVAQARGLWDMPETIDAFETLTPIAPWSWAGDKLVENKADGKGIVATLKAKIPGLDEYKLPGSSKPVRYRGVAPYWRSGNIYLPPPEMCIDPLTGENWLNDFRQEHTDAPGGMFDDQIDTSTMAITWFLVDDQSDDGSSTWDGWQSLLGE